MGVVTVGFVPRWPVKAPEVEPVSSTTGGVNVTAHPAQPWPETPAGLPGASGAEGPRKEVVLDGSGEATTFSETVSVAPGIEAEVTVSVYVVSAARGEQVNVAGLVPALAGEQPSTDADPFANVASSARPDFPTVQASGPMNEAIAGRPWQLADTHTAELPQACPADPPPAPHAPDAPQ
jgi:hypothetical protein